MSTKKKTGKLTKIELFYIENNSDKDAEEIAKDLNRSKALVEKHLELQNCKYFARIRVKKLKILRHQ